jgi:hypothetical protein
MPEGSSPGLQERFNALLTPLLLNGALAAIKTDRPQSALSMTTRALGLKPPISTQDQGMSLFSVSWPHRNIFTQAKRITAVRWPRAHSAKKTKQRKTYSRHPRSRPETKPSEPNSPKSRRRKRKSGTERKRRSRDCSHEIIYLRFPSYQDN